MNSNQIAILDSNRASLMHGSSAGHDSSFVSMCSKDSTLHKEIMSEYLNHWHNKEAQEKASSEKAETTMVNNYYDMVTDLFEYGWAQSFHFCRFQIHESFMSALARHEFYLASMLNIRPGARLLDAGCGIGGPARQIAGFTGANITGITINAYQIQRARKLTVQAGLDDQVHFLQANFLNTPFPDNCFDGAYAIEATLHASKLESVYSEIYRVLKPGSTFALYEWAMTPKYDPKNHIHKKICREIELGDGIPQLRTEAEALEAMRMAGFEVVHSQDLADNKDVRPWWFPLSGEWKYASNIWDTLTMFRTFKMGRYATMGLLKICESLALCPQGTLAAAQTLETAATSLIAGGEAGIFTPMFLMVGRKPLVSQ